MKVYILKINYYLEDDIATNESTQVLGIYSSRDAAIHFAKKLLDRTMGIIGLEMDQTAISESISDLSKNNYCSVDYLIDGKYIGWPTEGMAILIEEKGFDELAEDIVDVDPEH